MNVLLVSPLDPIKPGKLKFLMGGENTYTTTLLTHPPGGVKYTHHTEALQKGEISYTFWQPVLTWLIKLRVLPLDSGYHCIKLHKQFDLIHCHAYCLKLDGAIKPPVILGDSSSNYLFLRDYVIWHPIRISVQYSMRKWLHKLIGVYDKDLYLHSAKLLIVFSRFAKKIHAKLGIPINRIVVIPPGLPLRTARRKKTTKKITILFIGVWFERKGGILLLEAYKVLKKIYPRLYLTIIGPVPKSVDLGGLSIEQHNYVPYRALLQKYYPSADIFVLVPQIAEGYGLVVLEGLSFGIPVIVSDVYALPELIEHGKNGFVIPPGNVTRLIAALEILIDDESLRKKMGKAALMGFLKHFQVKKSNKSLAEVYRKAINFS